MGDHADDAEAAAYDAGWYPGMSDDDDFPDAFSESNPAPGVRVHPDGRVEGFFPEPPMFPADMLEKVINGDVPAGHLRMNLSDGGTWDAAAGRFVFPTAPHMGVSLEEARHLTDPDRPDDLIGRLRYDAQHDNYDYGYLADVADRLEHLEELLAGATGPGVTFLDRGDGPDTSSAAADQVLEREGGRHVVRDGSHKADLLIAYGRAAAFGTPALTDAEAAAAAGLHGGGWKRCADLRAGGWIERVGEKMGDHGSLVMTCTITDKGYARWQELDIHAPRGPRPEPPAPSLFG